MTKQLMDQEVWRAFAEWFAQKWQEAARAAESARDATALSVQLVAMLLTWR
jgi:hypothetical protein